LSDAGFWRTNLSRMNSVKNRPTNLLFLFVIFFTAATISGCGSSSDGASGAISFEKISDNGVILSIDDVKAAGWKRGKEYDVEGLMGAEAAYLGFWSPPGLTSLNYEIRIYPSHQAAVEQGTPFAEEGTGENAVLDAEDAMWPEGVHDRRVVVGGGSRGSQNPLYFDYVILNNLVILCEGRTSEHAIERCTPFVTLLLGEGA
jgi:hypothetical protein